MCSLSLREKIQKQFAPFRLTVWADVVRLYGCYSFGLLSCCKISFRPAIVRPHPVQYSDQGTAGDIGAVDSGFTPEEEEQIKTHLERLGYL